MARLGLELEGQHIGFVGPVAMFLVLLYFFLFLEELSRGLPGRPHKYLAHALDRCDGLSVGALGHMGYDSSPAGP